MHFRPTSSYLKKMSDFEVSIVCKYSFATSVHVVSNRLQQKGCLATVVADLKVARALPRLPPELEIVLVHVGTPTRATTERLRKIYGVRRAHVARALDGLCYGEPKGGHAHGNEPDDGKRYVAYEYADHIDGTKLRGRLFAVDCLLNSAYHDVVVDTRRLEAYDAAGNLPADLPVVHASGEAATHEVTDMNGDDHACAPTHEPASATVLEGALRLGQVHDCDELIALL
jgi:hypothetical protein